MERAFLLKLYLERHFKALSGGIFNKFSQIVYLARL